ncbi:MAG: glycoside hydrolase [Sulfolobaceae archaeon]|nr:glycoside hydrolase [Sulfolobaceae archaeon]
MRKEIILLLFLFLFLLISSLFIVTPSIAQSYNRAFSYSPSYLLLNNFEDDSIWIVTGIPEPNPILNGFPIYPPSIRNFYLGGYGLLNLTLNMNITTEIAYLTLNNSVVLESKQGNISIMTPPYTPYILLLFNANSTTEFTLITNESVVEVRHGEIEIKGVPEVFIATNVSYTTKAHEVIFRFVKGYWFIEMGLGAKPYFNISNLVMLNNKRVEEWLNESIKPRGLPQQLVNEYYLSLLVLKDDQNPYLGTFAASPSPIYLYSWVRDSSFSAIALQEAGHYSSALKFWLWLSRAQQLQPGVWYTRYDFYSGVPDTSFGIPELDGIGLFEIGVYQYYNLTGNLTFLREVLPELNLSVKYQLSQINTSRFHLIPQDLSVWEDRMAYHFWTEAFNALGLQAVARIYKALGLNSSAIILAENELNESIIKYFWYNNSYFASALGTSVLFTSSGAQTVLVPEPSSVNSATLLPIDMRFLPSNSPYAEGNFQTVLSSLTVNGGLARFPGDLYHYSEYLYDSSGPEPPWIITTMFEALYYEEIGQYPQALNIMEWAYEHSQHGLLPEAIDPHYGNPLPTTSPLTWSSAMYVIVALNYKPSAMVNNELHYIVAGVLIVAILASSIALTRKKS